METKANYVTVGIITLALIAAAFGFVYWTARPNQYADALPLEIVIPGSAAGLDRGSIVMFNGVRVGQVEQVYIDPKKPGVAIARAKVDRQTPLTRSTTANIVIAGLSFAANVDLKGGNADEPNLLLEAEKAGTVAKINANASSVNNLTNTAQELMTRADRVLTKLEGVVDDVREPVTNTAKNAETFSKALADNAEGIDKFLDSVGSLSETLKSVSGRLDTTLAAAEDVLKAVDAEKVSKIVDNADGFMQRLNESTGDLNTIMADISKASASLADVGGKASSTFDKVDKIMEGVKPEDVSVMVSNFRKASGDISAISERFAAKGEDIDKIIDNVSKGSASLADLGSKASGTFEKVDKIMEGVKPDDVSVMVSNFRKASEDISSISNRVAGKGEDIDKIIADTRQTMDRLNAASARVDGLLEKVDKMLNSGNGEGLVAEARATFKSFRQVADTLNERLGPITAGLSRFSTTGLRDVEAFVRDGRRAINRIESAISDLERNPQRIITGGAGEVRTIDGRRRR